MIAAGSQNGSLYDGHLDHHPVRIHEYLPADKSLLFGLQHAFAMFKGQRCLRRY